MKKNSLIMISVGLFLIALVLGAVLLAPILTKYDPTYADTLNRLQAPSIKHIMGTDHFGRDIFARILYGARITLPISFSIILLTAIMGTSLGILSAMNYGSLIDISLMRLVDVILAIPFIVLAMTVSAIFGRGLENILLVVVVIWWAPFTRYTRSLVLSLKNNEAIMAAKILGAGTFTIIRREILPNILSTIFIYLIFEFSSLILSLSTLSFFGLGSQPPTPEWGNMLSDGRTYALQSIHMLLWPILAIIITVLGLNLLGEGLRDYYYPYDIIVLRKDNEYE